MALVPNSSDSDIPEDCIDYRRCPRNIHEINPSILQRNDDFIIINKPWDVRMYGDFSITVEKLIGLWTGITTGLKWVHRLDYATSGVLCVGLTQQFAAAASFAFEKRLAKKEYVAVVQGHINIENYPGIANISFDLPSKKRKKPEVLEKLTPSWQDLALEKGLLLHFAALTQITLDSSIDPRIQTEVEELSKLSYEEFRGQNKLRKRLRKVLKSLGLLESITSEEASFIPSSTPCSIPEPIREQKVDIIPCSQKGYTYRLTPDQLHYLNNTEKFKIEGSDPPQFGTHEEGFVSDFLWINAPIQEIPGDFRMCIPAPDDETSEILARPCETKLKILQYGSYQGKPVTKVSLMPISGRRHQLRLHCLAMGHPIVGDATYGSLSDDDQSERMMLHARSLCIRLKSKGHESLVTAETDDPFQFEETGELKLA